METKIKGSKILEEKIKNIEMALQELRSAKRKLELEIAELGCFGISAEIDVETLYEHIKKQSPSI